MKLFVAGKQRHRRLLHHGEDSAGAAKTCTVPVVRAAETWTELESPLSEFSGVNLASVSSLTIGVRNAGQPRGPRVLLLVDDIRVGVKAMGLVAQYKLEGNLLDSSGNGHDGTLGGDANLPVKYVAGPTGFGQGMLFDGTGGHQNVELGTFNPSAATGQLTVALWAKWDGRQRPVAGPDRQTRRLGRERHDVASRGQPGRRYDRIRPLRRLPG